MQPRVGLGVFIFRSPGDSRFVLGKRKGSIGAGSWALPGGHLEHGETFEQCAVREVAEETGMEIEDVKFLTATESIFEADQKHYVTIFVKAFASKGPGGDVVEPKLLEPNKCEAWIWKSFQEMCTMGEAEDVKLFQPLYDLKAQRPSICAELDAA